jgi:hypothetical protein
MDYFLHQLERITYLEDTFMDRFLQLTLSFGHHTYPAFNTYISPPIILLI